MSWLLHLGAKTSLCLRSRAVQLSLKQYIFESQPLPVSGLQQGFHRLPLVFSQRRPSSSTAHDHHRANNGADPSDATSSTKPKARGHAYRKSKHKRSSTAKAPLAKIARDAQASHLRGLLENPASHRDPRMKTVTALCVAQEYDLEVAQDLLQKNGIPVGPCGTILYPEEPQVIHVELPFTVDSDSKVEPGVAAVQTGDVFVFPSGTVVAWGVPNAHVLGLTSRIISPAARKPWNDAAEEEALDYLEDEHESRSCIRGETIVLGTKPTQASEAMTIRSESTPLSMRNDLSVVLAKIAFSSGLARATKISVLENLVNEYFDSTRSILGALKGRALRMRSRRYVYERIGTLLDLRAQLNLYSELTDDLPDLLWDTRAELGMENYYNQVGRALNTGVRIRALNQKMDYGESIVHSLRDMRSEIHSSRLEIIIIVLIASEIFLVLWTEFRIPALVSDLMGRRETQLQEPNGEK